MKLDVPKTEVESNGLQEEESFSIGDMGFVLEILRNKLYSNIKKAICQEYSCNARDAHREVGKSHIPIEITLPTHLEQNWRCRDYGPGIDPERISNIFIRYGVSTKRDSNVQTGSFGLGAKCAFGYSDSFVVNTFIDGTKRSYACVIDDTRKGKIALLSTSPTTEVNGTEIVVPVQVKDIAEFTSETKKATRHWTLKPLIKGGKIDYNDFQSVFLSGTDWMILKGSAKKVFLVVDGVEYPLDENRVDMSNFPKFGYTTETYLSFNTGELSIAANRESIDMDAKSKKNVEKKIGALRNELHKKLEEKITNASSYVEACRAAQEASSSLGLTSIVHGLKWNGHTLQQSTSIRFEYDVASSCIYTKRYNGTVNKVATQTIDFGDSNNLICFTDRSFDRVTENGAIALLKKFPAKTQITMIRVSDAAKFAKYPFGLIETINFDDHYVYKEKKAILGKLTFFKLSTDGVFYRTSVKEFEADTKPKCWVKITAEEKAPINPNGGILNYGNFMTEVILPKYSVYAFNTKTTQEKIEAATEDLIHVTEAATALVEESGFTLDQLYLANATVDLRYSELFSSEFSKQLKQREDMFFDKNNILVEYNNKFSEFKKQFTDMKKYRGYLPTNVLENISNDRIKPYAASFREEAKEVLAKYPLLANTFETTCLKTAGKTNMYYDYRELPRISLKTDEIVDYVNMVDMANKYKEEQKAKEEALLKEAEAAKLPTEAAKPADPAIDTEPVSD
jgi:hypothetical protein